MAAYCGSCRAEALKNSSEKKNQPSTILHAHQVSMSMCLHAPITCLARFCLARALRAKLSPETE